MYGIRDCMAFGELMMTVICRIPFGMSASLHIYNGFGITRTMFWHGGCSERHGTDKTEFSGRAGIWQ